MIAHQTCIICNKPVDIELAPSAVSDGPTWIRVTPGVRVGVCIDLDGTAVVLAVCSDDCFEIEQADTGSEMPLS